MADGAVGTVSFNVRFTKESIQQELGSIANKINTGFKGAFSGMGKQMRTGIKDTVANMNKVTDSTQKMKDAYAKTEEKISSLRTE